MFELRQTPVFETWFLGLRKKHRAREAIAKRLVRLEAGNFGDTKALGGGVNELRIQHGPGYRLYYTVRRQSIILLPCGGTKGSQARDIRRAKALEKEMDDEDNTV